MTVAKYTDGQRVVVDVRKTEEWNTDVLDVLQGRVGRVGSVKTRHHNGQAMVDLDAPRYLVLFDEPTRATSRGTTHSGFWFDEDEIQSEREP